MKLPNADNAVVDLRKLRDYCLSMDHPRGKHKARVFDAVLGLTDADAEILQGALLRAALQEEATATDADEYGQRYVIDFRMSGPDGEGIVRSAWIMRTNENFPRLTSCYVR
jgi:hypothetical protein